MSWTDERVELLKQLWLDGKSASQISAQLGHGTTRNAVIGKVHRLGLSGRVKSSTPAAPRVRHRSPSSSSPRSAAPRSGGGMRHATRGNAALAMAFDPMLDPDPVLYEDVVVPMSLRVTIVDLKEAMCKWPLGDPTTPEFRYCGSPSLNTGPYCTYHGRLAYQPAQDRRRDRDRRASR
jgi:GcrA cell cycle regulator